MPAITERPTPKTPKTNPGVDKKSKAGKFVALFERFPLEKIKNEAQHEKALEVIQSLMGTGLSKEEGDFLDLLIILVDVYENKNHAIETDMTPRQAVRALMEANNLSQADIGKIIGSESAVSMFLKGQRELSKNHIRKLADRFKVGVGVFM